MIFVFDLDGTICFKGRPLTEEICAALDMCTIHGHEVVFASARPIRDMLPVLPKRYYHYRMVGGNGAFTFVKGDVQLQSFSEQTIAELKTIIEKYNLQYLIDSDWDYSFTGEESHPIYQNLDPLKTATNKPLTELHSISKAVLFTNNEEIKEHLKKLPVTLYEHGDEGLIDISPQNVHKVAGLQRLGIEPNTYIAFGNDQNDQELFQHAHYSVCVGNHDVAQFANEQIMVEDVPQRIKQLAKKFS
ncbi:HAD-IIB family hydrolase [Solibacillus sp. CAU 1738]|uniref:HAD-IIB family hydrolase n=1 Tax=Solibacillus sp. CAU 1738 TaxID=3140363 RepID=UPI003261D049